MITIKEEKIAEMMFDIWQESNKLKNPVMVGEYIANKVKEAINYTHCCESDSDQLAEHKCKFYVNADWSYLRCDCGKRIKPSEG